MCDVALVQEGSIALWRCIDKFDVNYGSSFLTYAKPSIRNAMIDLISKNTFNTNEIRLDDTIKNEEQLLLAEIIADPYSKSPEQAVVEAETIREMYKALRQLNSRKRTYLLYRFGFHDEREHSTADTAFNFSLSVSRAKSIEKSAIDKMRKLMFP